MEDILQSIKAFLYDRAVSPLFGALIISWAGWNYRLLVILLSEETYSSKFESIDQFINSYTLSIPGIETSFGFYAGSGALFPVLTALAYIYIYPLVAEPVYKHSLKKQKSIKRLKKEADDSRIIDEKESRQLFIKLAEMQNRYDKDIGEYQKQVNSLRAELNEISQKEDTNPIHEELNKLSDKKLQEIIDANEINDKNQTKEIIGSAEVLNEDAQTVLIAMSHNPYWEDPSTTSGRVSLHRLRFTTAFDLLVGEGYVEVNDDEFGEKVFRISKKGEKYLVDNNLV